MKAKLYVLAALILLSSINSIFNNIPIGVSAQEYEEIDDDRNGSNEMVENYSYEEEPNVYNTDNGYNANIDPSMDGQNSEYSTYGSYEPANYGNVEEEYSSHDNYEYLYSEYLKDDYSTETPSSYEEESYGSDYYPPKKPQKFTCPDSGLVVDTPESCPLICPAGTTLEGHFVKAGSNLMQICNVDQEELESCPAGTDLEGVFVTDATTEQCNIFATCPATSPLGQALGLEGTETVEVADAQLCELDVPPPTPATQIFVCPSTATADVPFPNPEMAGQNVTSLELCMVATPAVLCQDGTTLNGTWVHPNSTATCNLVIPPPVPTFTCLAVAGNNPALVGAQVTDVRLCQAPTVPNICPINTDLAGVFANNTLTDCDLNLVDIDANITTDTEAQCLKCADLAIFFAEDEVIFDNIASGFIGPPPAAARNIFDVCNDANPRPGFNTLVPATGIDNRATIISSFDRCLDNAAVNPGNSSSFQTQALSLQENSLTTNVKPEAEIPSVFESFSALESSLQENSLTTNAKPEDGIPTVSGQMSPPTIAQGAEGSPASSDALEKIEKLKKQWLELLP